MVYNSVITLRKRMQSGGLLKKDASTLGVGENRTIIY